MITPPPSRAGSLRKISFAVLSALVFAGCAQLPPSSEAAITPFGADKLKSEESFKQVAAAEWPKGQWWKTYGDEQLNALIDEALRDSPDMALAVARLHKAQASSDVAQAALRPEVTANGSATEQKQSQNYLTPKEMTPKGWQDYGRATLDFSWEIDFFGKNRAALAAATSELDARQADMAQARLTLVSNIATSYAELARLYAEQDTAQAALQVRTTSTKLFSERFVNGLETKGSVKQAEAREAGAEGDLLQLDEQISLQCNRLAALVGAGPDRARSIARPKIDFDSPPVLPANLAADLLGRRPDVVSARLLVEAQSQRIKEKKAEFYPNVNLTGFIGFQSLGLDMLTKNGSQIGSIGPAISLPIFNGGRLRGQLRSSEANYEEAVATYNQTLTQALQEVANAYMSKKMLEPRLQSANQAVDASRDAYDVLMRRYQGGLATYLEVLSAQDTLLTNLRSLTDLQARAFTLDVDLKRALGGGYEANNS